MTSLKNQLKRIKKDLGKPRFTDYISNPSVYSKYYKLVLSLFGAALSLLSWYVFYLDARRYGIYLDWDYFWELFWALFLSISWLNLYDVYKSFVYNTFAFIGDRGIAIVQVRQRNQTVVKSDHLFFSQIDKIIIDDERH